MDSEFLVPQGAPAQPRCKCFPALHSDLPCHSMRQEASTGSGCGRLPLLGTFSSFTSLLGVSREGRGFGPGRP